MSKSNAKPGKRQPSSEDEYERRVDRPKGKGPAAKKRRTSVTAENSGLVQGLRASETEEDTSKIKPTAVVKPISRPDLCDAVKFR